MPNLLFFLKRHPANTYENMYLDNVDGFSNLDILLSHGFYHILFAIFKVSQNINLKWTASSSQTRILLDLNIVQVSTILGLHNFVAKREG